MFATTSSVLESGQLDSVIRRSDMLYDSRQYEKFVSAISQHVADALLGRRLDDDELRNIVERVSHVATIEMQPGTLTPPQVAKRLRVSPDKVLAWIRSSELRAVNVATRDSTRPRYRVTINDLKAFEERRSTSAGISVPRRNRRPPTDVIEFF